MASTQLQRGANSDKCNPLNQWQNGAMVTMNNHTYSTMTLERSKNWAGVPALGKFPRTIAPGRSASFTHLRGGEYGSNAGVQYNGYSSCGAPCAWILVWRAPVEDSPPCPPNQVYVACGRKSEMDAMSWEEIIMNLDAASTYDLASDPSLKVSVDASIHDQTPNTACVNANFRLNVGTYMTKEINNASN